MVNHCVFRQVGNPTCCSDCDLTRSKLTPLSTQKSRFCVRMTLNRYLPATVLSRDKSTRSSSVFDQIAPPLFSGTVINSFGGHLHFGHRSPWQKHTRVAYSAAETQRHCTSRFPQTSFPIHNSPSVPMTRLPLQSMKTRSSSRDRTRKPTDDPSAVRGNRRHDPSPPRR